MKIFSKFAFSLLISCCFLLGTPLTMQAQAVKGSVGSIAPNIELPDQYGNKIALSDLRGNLVLLRFWQSGDPNSRASNASINTLYQKYQNASFQTAKGFAVFTVSLDSRLDKWKMALTQDQLPENYHTHDIYSKYVASYGVRSLPTNFLLDENGMIIASTNSMAALDMELSKRAQVYVNTTQPTTPDIINTSDVHTPDVFTQPTPTIDMTGGKTSYMIQLGAYKNWDETRFMDAAEYGFVTAEEAGNGIKRALLGKFTTPEDMVSTLSKLRDIGYKDAFPVEYNGNARGRIVGKKETAAIAAEMGISVTEAVITTPPMNTGNAPETMSVASNTPITSVPEIMTTTPTKTESGTYQYPFSIGSEPPITNIPDSDISATYHSGNTSVITSTAPNIHSGNVATFNSDHNAGSAYSSGGFISESKTTVVPSEIPVFTGGVTPAADPNSGTYYDSDAYELSWYPSTPSQTQPNIIESPYYNNNPTSQDPNAPQVPNYDNNANNNGWQQGGWNNSGNTQWNNETTDNNGGWSEWQPVDNINNNPNSNNAQPTTDGQWNNGQMQAPDANNYPEPNNQQLDQSLNNYLNNYDFSSVDENSDRITTTKKKKKKRKKKKKKKKRR